MTQHARWFAAAVLVSLGISGCAQQTKTDTLERAIATAAPTTLAREKPVLAACAGVKLIATNPGKFGLQDLRNNVTSLHMTSAGAATWTALTMQVQQAAGPKWMDGSQAATMLFGNWVLFSQPISAALNATTKVSNPDVTKVKTALRRLQDACTNIYQKNWYQVIR